MNISSELQRRNLDPSKYHVHYDDEVACFYLFNLTGQIVGYQQYRPAADKTKKNNPRDGRYYTFNKSGSVAVWGLETWSYRDDILFVCEGIFDACRFHNFGLPAIAVLANDPKQLRPWLRTIPRFTVAAVDNDPAGMKLVKLCDTAIFPPAGLDFGDLTSDDVKIVIERWI